MLYNYNGFVAPRLNFDNFRFHCTSFFVVELGEFPAALPYTVRLVRRLQYQVTRSC